jgi:hypothetical protein
MSEKSYDDQFDGPAFAMSQSLMRLKGPKRWPKSVSQMRSRTSYAAQGISGLSNGDAAFDYKMNSAPAAVQTFAAPIKMASAVTPGAQMAARSVVKSAQKKGQNWICVAGVCHKTSMSGAMKAKMTNKSASADTRQWSWKESSSA